MLQIPWHYFSQILVPRMRLHVANCLLTQTCLLPWYMNEQGHKLGVYIESGTTERHYRQRIRAGIRRDPTESEADHREAQRQGRYLDLNEDLPTATGTTRTDAETNMPTKMDRREYISSRVYITVRRLSRLCWSLSLCLGGAFLAIFKSYQLLQ